MILKKTYVYADTLAQHLGPVCVCVCACQKESNDV